MPQYDIVLIRPNDKKAIYGTLPDSSTASDPPYWLALMGGWLRDKGLKVSLIDAEYENQSPEETARKVIGLKPALVGVLPLGSNLATATWKMNGAGILVKALKALNSGLPVFIWGYHVSALPERTLKEEEFDFVVAGEGFETVYNLTRLIIDKSMEFSELDKITGLWFRHGGEIFGSPGVELIHDLDALPFDGWELLPSYKYRGHLHFSLEDLSKRDSYGAVMSSLGCPYNCSFCSLKYFSGDRRVRTKSPERVADEIEYLVKRFNVFYLRIIDECFTLNKKRTIEVCDAIINRNLDTSIWVYARIDTLDKELLDKMYSANIKWVGLGIESGNKDVRTNVEKGQYSLDSIKSVVKMCLDAGISVCDNYMFGLPGDTLETMKDTLALAKELNCGYPNMYCTMAYPGSQLYNQALREGWELPDSWLGYSQLSYDTHPLPTESLASRQVLEFRDFAFNDFFTNNEPYYEMIYNKFGQQAVDAIKDMAKGRLKRKLLGD